MAESILRATVGRTLSQTEGEHGDEVGWSGETGAADDSAAIGWAHALRIATNRHSMRRTVLAAAVVGTVLTLVSLASQIATSPLAPGLLIKLVLTYMVPWGNATLGIAIGVRDRDR